MSPALEEYGVVILGGGFAGQTLALQIIQRRPRTRVLVLERLEFPVPEAAWKIGESTVELGAYYLRETLGLREYLEARHLEKLGARFFFSGDTVADDLSQRIELGPSNGLPVVSHQIDRGRFENDVAQQLRELGVDLRDGARVTSVEVGEGKAPHTIEFVAKGESHVVRARWLADTSGRASFMKRKLKLELPVDHEIDAVWFRVSKEIDIDDWCDDPAWRARVAAGKRRLSTNHMMGRGYWVWIIPLSTGATSIGIVADSAIYPSSTFNTMAKAMSWLWEHEPLVARALQGCEDKLMDFAVRKNYSTNIERSFSSDRWAITGDAGFFLDPLYSPGADFIAIGNTFTTALVLRDLSGAPIGTSVEVYNTIYLSLFKTWLPVYRHQYACMGNDRVMATKVLWDFGLYWAVFVPTFVNEVYTDVLQMARLRAHWTRLDELHSSMQQLFLEFADVPCSAPNAFINPLSEKWVGDFHRSMTDKLEPLKFAERLAQNMAGLEALAQELRAQVESSVLTPGYAQAE